MICLIFFFTLISVVNAQTTTKGSTWEQTCEFGKCTKTLYGVMRYAQNKEGEWVDASDVLSITKNQDDITFHYSGIKGDFGVTFETGVIYNGNYFSMSTVKQNYPEINFDFPHWKYPTHRKYAVNISDMDKTSLDTSKIWNITLSYKSHYGFTLNQLKQKNRWFHVKNFMALYFDDLLKVHPLKIIKSEKRIYISNITDNIVNGNLYLDPVVMLQNATTKVLEDTWVDLDSSGPTTEYLQIGYDNYGASPGNSTYGFIKFNITGLGEVTDSILCLYDYDDYGYKGSQNLNYTVFNVTDETWTEGSCTSPSACPSRDTQINKTGRAGLEDAQYWQCFNVTTGVQEATDSSQVNVTFAINTTANLSYNYFHGARFLSRDYVADPTGRPYLNVTYAVGVPLQYYDNTSSIPTYDGTTKSTFNITWNSSYDSLSVCLIEGNWSGSAQNYTMTNDTSGNCDYEIILPGGSHYWKSYANDTDGDWNSTDKYEFTASKGTSDAKAYISNATSNQSVTYPTSVEIRGNSTTTLTPPTFNLYVGSSSLGSGNPKASNVTMGQGTHNVVYNTSGNANWTSASNSTLYLIVSGGAGVIYSFSLNDTTYININESSLLVVNASDNANITFELQKPSGSQNYTTSHNGSHYTKAITKTELGDGQNNVSDQINITRIYLDGQNYTWTSNTTTLNFTYAMTNHSSSISHTEIYTPDAITWTAYYNEEVTNTVITSTCNLTVFGNSYTMDISGGVYSRSISTLNKDGSFTWTINCTNPSYQSRSSEGTVIVRAGSTPAGYTGGGGGRGPIIIAEEPERIVIYGETRFEISRPYSGMSELVGVPGKRSREECFDVKNIGTNNITLDVVVIGDIKDWVTITTDKVVQLDPGETKSTCYYIDIPSTQGTCLTPCQAFKVQLVDHKSGLYVSFISKWSFLPTGGLANFLRGLSEKVFRIQWVGSPTRKLPVPMILLPLFLAIITGWVVHRAKFGYWSGLMGLIVFLLTMVFI